MKIMVIGNAGNPHMQKWCKFYLDAGYEVFLVSREKVAEKIQGVKFFKLPRILGDHIDLFFHFLIMRWLALKYRPDVVNSHYATVNALLGIFAGIKPLIISVWGSDIYLTPRRTIFHEIFIKYVLSKADTVCSTSRVMKDEILKYYPFPDKIHVIPFGVDLDVFGPRREGKKHGIRLGTIKRMVDGKGYNHAELIKIFSNLQREYPDMTLELVGSGPIKDKLQGFARGLGLNGNVKFHGRLSHKDIPGILNSWDIYCCTSTQENESFGVAAVEASACEVPVVAFKVGGLTEVIKHGETGVLVEPGDFKAFEHAIRKLLGDNDMRRYMGKNGRSYVYEKYDWRNNGREMLGVIRSVYAKQN